ncbi:MAG TPA: P-loop NTPase [Actinomycetota bacterium]
MRETRIIAVGVPQTFRQHVARAMEIDADSVQWVPTVTAVEGLLSEGHVSPDVLVLSAAVKEQEAFGLAEFVGRSSPATAVVLVRDRNLNGILPAAMRAGIRDVVDLSRGGQELRDALIRAAAWSKSLRSFATDDESARDSRPQGSVVSVFSSKGGTGKTFLACNLAAAIAERSKSDVALLDFDFEMGDVFSYFGTEPKHPVQDFLALGDQADREAILSFGKQLHDHLFGFGAVPDPSAPPISGEAVGKVLRTFRSTFEYTVIDATADYSDSTLAAFDLSDTVCLITGLDVVGVRHLSMAMKTLRSLGYPEERFRIVMNRADSKVGLTPDEIQRAVKLRVDDMIPSSRLVPTSLNMGLPIVIHQPRADVSKAVLGIADRLIVHTPAPSDSKRRLFKKK